MFNRTLKIAAAVLSLGVAVLAPTAACAQNPPMDMSWAIRSQMNAYNQGQANANAAAMQYMRYMQQLRAAGYTGPSLPRASPTSPSATLMPPTRPARRTTGPSSTTRSRRNATHDYSMRAIRGCTPYVDHTGVCSTRDASRRHHRIRRDHNNHS
jgi:hypothetical protein